MKIHYWVKRYSIKNSFELSKIEKSERKNGEKEKKMRIKRIAFLNLFHKDTINRDEFQLLIVSTDDFRTVSRKKKFYTRLIDDEMQTFVETTNNLSIRPIPRPFRRGKKKIWIDRE